MQKYNMRQCIILIRFPYRIDLVHVLIAIDDRVTEINLLGHLQTGVRENLVVVCSYLRSD